jgi:hypothetical protein
MLAVAQAETDLATSNELPFYSSSLAAINEPRLASFASDPSVQTYRITIYPSLGINTIAIGVEKQGEIYSVYARRLERSSGPAPGKLVESRNIRLGG